MSKHILLLGALLVISSCDSKTDSLLTDKSEDSVRVKMDVRLNATHSMRKFLDQLEGATGPVDGALEEIAKVVSGDFKIPTESKEIAKRTIIPKLRDLLKKARKDLVHVNENGSFVSTTRIEWPVARETTQTRKSCKTSTLLIQGNWSEKASSQATIVLDDCTSMEPIVLVSASLDSEKNFSAQVNYGNLRRLSGDQVTADVGGCEIRATQTTQTVSCDPFTTDIEGNDIAVEKMVWKRVSNDVSGDVVLTVYPKGNPAVQVFATFEGGKPKIVLKKVQE